MIRFYGKVFEDYVVSSTSSYSSIQHMSALARGDQIGVQAVVDFASRSGTITVQIEHSSDGINFVNKNSSPEITASVTGGAAPTPRYGGETWPPVPSREYVRFRIDTTGAGGSATMRVALHAVVRDRAPKDDAACGCSGGCADGCGADGMPDACGCGEKSSPKAHKKPVVAPKRLALAARDPGFGISAYPLPVRLGILQALCPPPAASALARLPSGLSSIGSSGPTVGPQAPKLGPRGFGPSGGSGPRGGSSGGGGGFGRVQRAQLQQLLNRLTPQQRAQLEKIGSALVAGIAGGKQVAMRGKGVVGSPRGGRPAGGDVGLPDPYGWLGGGSDSQSQQFDHPGTSASDQDGMPTATDSDPQQPEGDTATGDPGTGSQQGDPSMVDDSAVAEGQADSSEASWDDGGDDPYADPGPETETETESASSYGGGATNDTQSTETNQRAEHQATSSSDNAQSPEIGAPPDGNGFLLKHDGTEVPAPEDSAGDRVLQVLTRDSEDPTGAEPPTSPADGNLLGTGLVQGSANDPRAAKSSEGPPLPEQLPKVRLHDDGTPGRAGGQDTGRNDSTEQDHEQTGSSEGADRKSLADSGAAKGERPDGGHVPTGNPSPAPAGSGQPEGSGWTPDPKGGAGNTPRGQVDLWGRSFDVGADSGGPSNGKDPKVPKFPAGRGSKVPPHGSGVTDLVTGFGGAGQGAGGAPPYQPDHPLGGGPDATKQDRGIGSGAALPIPFPTPGLLGDSAPGGTSTGIGPGSTAVPPWVELVGPGMIIVWLIDEIIRGKTIHRGWLEINQDIKAKRRPPEFDRCNGYRLELLECCKREVCEPALEEDTIHLLEEDLKGNIRLYDDYLEACIKACSET